MTTIAQRRVAGATALMILLYLLQVALISQPASAADTNYKFVFQNGVEVTGSVTGGDATIDDSVFEEFYAPDAVPFDLPVSIHVSCSETFPDGWNDNGDFPNEVDHSDWQISWYKIDKFAGQERSCGETFEKGSITVVKNTTPVTSENFAFELSGTLPPAPGSSGTDPIEYGPDGTSVAGNGGSATWDGLDAGAYELVELTASNPAGYSFSSVECVDDAEGVVVASPGANPAVFDLAGGQHITCTFTNTADAPPTPVTVSVSGQCAVVEGAEVGQFTVNIEDVAGNDVTVDVLGQTGLVDGAVVEGALDTTHNWTASSASGDFAPTPANGTTSASSGCLIPPPPPPPPPSTTTTTTLQSTSVNFDAFCDDAGNFVGAFSLPNASGSLDINGDGVFGAGETNLGSDTYVLTGDTYMWQATADAGFTLTGLTSGSGATEVCAEVLGTTITTAPAEVSADTLPFTGFESGDTAKLGLLALLAGVLMLFAVRGPKEEEAAATDIGGWTSL